MTTKKKENLSLATVILCHPIRRLYRYYNVHYYWCSLHQGHLLQKKGNSINTFISLSLSLSRSLCCLSVCPTGVMLSSVLISLIGCDRDMSERVYVVHLTATFEVNI